MHGALWMLTKLRFYASWRRLFRGVKTLRGALLLLFGIGFLAVMVVPSMMIGRDGNAAIGGLNFIQNYGAFALMLYTLSVLFFAIGDQTLFFTPSEVDTLFAAPLSRKDLLVYKIANNLASTLMISLILACTNRLHFRYFYAGLVGLVLSFFFIQLLGMFVSLLGQTLSKRAYTRGRRLVGGLIIAILAFAFSQVLVQWQGGDIRELPGLVEATTTGRVLLFPFRTFCNVMVAEQLFPEFIVSVGIASAIVGALLSGIFWLDADYSEVSVRVSRQRLQKQQRMQRGSLFVSSKDEHQSYIPMLGFMQGAGPLAWRQLVKSIRGAGVAARIGLIVGLVVGVPLILRGWKETVESPMVPYMVWGGLVYLSTLMVGAMPTGFRVDIERMEVFKNLPVSPWAVVLGQLAGTTTVMVAGHWLIFLVLTVAMPHFAKEWLMGAVVSPFFCAVVISMSSGLFLLYPTKLNTGGTPDVTVGIKTMLTLMCQYLGLALEIAIVAAVVAGVFWLTKSTVAAVAATVLCLSLEAIAGVCFVWWAYRRFDVTKHMP